LRGNIETMKRLQQIVCDKDILKLGKVDKGFRFERTTWEYGDREKIFYKKWKEENKRKSWINQGQGALQNLFAHQKTKWYLPQTWQLIINNRDRYIVATVMQWFGTNCGWCFLEECLAKCGYKIVKADEQKEKEIKAMNKELKRINKIA